MTELRLDIVHCHHCGKRHVDDGEYAKKNHSMHRCEHCRRFFFTASNVGVAHKPLALNSEDHPGGIAIWPAASPVFDTRKTRNRGSEHGFHVHAYGDKGIKTIDGTWDDVTIDGKMVAPEEQ